MFGNHRRSWKRRPATIDDIAVAHEITELKRQVALLRAELDQVREDAGPRPVDIRAERRRRRHRRSQQNAGFAEAWQEQEVGEDEIGFFELGDVVDQRARKWLLTNS